MSAHPLQLPQYARGGSLASAQMRELDAVFAAVDREGEPASVDAAVHQLQSAFLLSEQELERAEERWATEWMSGEQPPRRNDPQEENEADASLPSRLDGDVEVDGEQSAVELAMDETFRAMVSRQEADLLASFRAEAARLARRAEPILEEDEGDEGEEGGAKGKRRRAEEGGRVEDAATTSGAMSEEERRIWESEAFQALMRHRKMVASEEPFDIALPLEKEAESLGPLPAWLLRWEAESEKGRREGVEKEGSGSGAGRTDGRAEGEVLEYGSPEEVSATLQRLLRLERASALPTNVAARVPPRNAHATTSTHPATSSSSSTASSAADPSPAAFLSSAATSAPGESGGMDVDDE
jgi:hypothetical protein